MTQPAPPQSAGARTVRVPDERAGQRLDNFLLGQLKGAPRSLVYKLVRSGQVRINGGRAKAERKLEVGDEVRIPPVRIESPQDAGRLPPKTMLAALEAAIVFEDARLLAINKPSGVASHGGSGISFGVIETLRALRPRDTLELVHRLDRDTSGLLVLAKKRSALTELQRLLREDHGLGIEKRYLALLVGRMPDGIMSVDAPLHIGLRQGGERHVQVNAIGKPSISHFRALERRGGQSYCEIRIETGRTHQIRVHAQHIGHPVAGDDKYGDEAANKRLREQVGLKRLFLHASTLEFALEGGKTPYSLHAPLVPELVEALDRLR
ncbi:MAG TPA: RluA family pseudouridine synthase [Thermomonas sp.]|jgi:23S rRNA pseudouridine955/2504/2580 synthase|uniref:RluA family pseudouridine synthase n=1 Tax=Thermomonas sp. TaxID=1971895 RepID=UPI002D19DC72|nr:RluA family pseudouridine synthase [Thermomonas sp.]HOV95330.1 RluA family pseudouridine synthase [Thermomonas sp.]